MATGGVVARVGSLAKNEKALSRDGGAEEVIQAAGRGKNNQSPTFGGGRWRYHLFTLAVIYITLVLDV